MESPSTAHLDPAPSAASAAVTRTRYAGFSVAAIARIGLCGLAVVLGGLQAWASRFDLVNDTVSYLDMGNLFFHGHLHAIVNGLWSPLYAFLLGAVLSLFHPVIDAEFPAVHLLLFFIYLFALASFEYFLFQLNCYRVHLDNAAEAADEPWTWVVFAHVLFLWSSLELIRVSETNPDMLVAAFFYLACALLLKIACKRDGWTLFASLGVVIGLGYLTKAVFLPVGLMLVAAAWIISRQRRAQVIAAAMAFLVIAGPFIAALSIQMGRFTTGETGKYNYAVHVNGLPPHHWSGGGEYGMPIHPEQEILSAPATYKFATPIPGTYPVWFDPSYWYEGVTPRLHLRQQLRAVVDNSLAELHSLRSAIRGILPLALVVIVVFAADRRRTLLCLSRLWFLIFPSLAALFLYALVHYETRYAGAFFVVILGCLLAAVLWTNGGQRTRLSAVAALLSLAGLLYYFSRDARPVPARNAQKGSYQAAAHGAVSMGLREGDSIASLNFSNLGMVQWAHLARLRIIAEIYYWPGDSGSTTSFWAADEATQQHLLQLFREAGARAVVSSDAPTGPDAARWARIGNTGYYLYWLNR